MRGFQPRFSAFLRSCVAATFVASCTTSFAEPPRSPDRPTPADDAGALTMQNQLDLIQSGTYSNIADSRYNTENEVLKLPLWQLSSEFRPNFKLLYDQLTFVARPRYELVASQTQVAGQKGHPEIATSRFFFNELFGTWQASDAFQFSYGLQNFQWGPSETINPSNRIFPEVQAQTTPFYEYRGRWLGRANLSLGQDFSLVLLGETMDSGAPAEYSGKPWGRKIAAKAEYSWNEGASYLGGVVGGGNHTRTWVGEYLALGVSDAVTLYLDASHTQGSDAFYPVPAGYGGISIQQSRATSSQLSTLGVLGARYTFESGTELRGEYILNQYGYTKSEESLAARAVSMPEPMGSLWARRAASTGLTLPGQHYGYLSVRARDVWPQGKGTILGRYLVSTTDFSGILYADWEWAYSDSKVLYLIAGYPHGPNGSELARYNRGFFILAHRFTF